MDFKFDLDLERPSDICPEAQYCPIHTSQFVAVRGTRENIHPSCDGRSEVKRIYLLQ